MPLETDVQKAPGVSTNGKPQPVVTILSEGDLFQGRVVIKGDGHLLGEFQGDVECDGELLIGKDARVTANIRTINITISGDVRGNIYAAGRLRITNSGRLEGDARIGSLVVQEGGIHHGIIHVHPEGIPEEADPEPVAELPGPSGHQPRQLSQHVERVKKMWGELF